MSILHDCSSSGALTIDDLRSWDSSACTEVPVARYLDANCGAVLWLTRSRSKEQTVEVLLRNGASDYGDCVVSASTDWSVPPEPKTAGQVWLSGFVVTAPLPSGTRAMFTTGLLSENAHVVPAVLLRECTHSVPSLLLPEGAAVRPEDSVAGAFIVCLNTSRPR